MKTSPLTKDLKKIVVSVTGISPKCVFNDKRKTFKRKYKFSGIYNVSDENIETINKMLRFFEKH